MRILITTCVISYICFACKPFDSNKLNYGLIQNTWEQVQIVFPDEASDSLVTIKPEGLTLLSFDADSCKEEMPDLGHIKKFGYEIKNYTLKLDEKDKEPQFMNIMKLTSDSLIVQSKYHRRKYVKRKL